MNLTLRHGIYIALTRFDERAIPKQAGFRWDKQREWWTTDNPDQAVKLIDYADAETRATLAALYQQRHDSLEASRATDADIDVPAPTGLSYMPFQRAGIAYASGRPATLIADEMG